MPYPFLFTLFGFFVIRIPLAAFFSFDQLSWLDWTGLQVRGLNWGVEGAWYAMIIDVAVRGSLATLRFVQGGWKRIDL